MMPRLATLLAAEGVSLDQLSGRVTAFNMIDHVALASVPSTLTRCAVMLTYEMGSEEDAFLERVKILSPDNHELAVSQTTVAIAARQAGHLPSSHTSIHMFWGVPLASVGDYSLVAEKQLAGTTEWALLASKRITVVIQPNILFNAPAVAGTRATAPEEAPRSAAHNESTP